MTPATVQAFVAQHHAPDDTLYVLLDLLADCTSEDPLHIEALHQTLGREAITPLLRPDLMHTPLACPVLVTLAEPGRSPSQQLLALSALRAKEDFFRHKRSLHVSPHRCPHPQHGAHQRLDAFPPAPRAQG